MENVYISPKYCLLSMVFSESIAIKLDQNRKLVKNLEFTPPFRPERVNQEQSKIRRPSETTPPPSKCALGAKIAKI